MSSYHKFRWGSPSWLEDRHKETKSEIRKTRRKLNKPIKRNGEPYAEVTIEAFKRTVNDLLKDKEHIKKTIETLKAYGVNMRSSVEYPALHDAWWRHKSFDYIGGLIKTKNLAENTDNTFDEIERMVAFIFDQNKNYREFQTPIYDCVLKNFVEILDEMISDLKENGRLKRDKDRELFMKEVMEEMRERIHGTEKVTPSLKVINGGKEKRGVA